MLTTEIVIKNKTGLHARPASEFISTANKFKSNVYLKRLDDEEEKVNAKSIMSLLMLALCEGDHAELTCEGEDENEALTALTNLIDSGFGE